MPELRCTLISDGSSDKALLPILTWALRQNGISYPIQSARADLGRLPTPPGSLRGTIVKGIELYPCDLLFIHRDVENQTRKQREDEINAALREVVECPPTVFVLPIRMTEAWLMFDEHAIRMAADNPNGSVRLVLPAHQSEEGIPDPKEQLYNLLRRASELRGRS